jgi:hypothetical protein
MGTSRIIVLAAIACLAHVTPPAKAGRIGPSQVSPEADRLLRRMSEFLGQKNAFSVKVDGTTEAILRSGQKVQVHASGAAYVKRPGKLRIDKRGDDGTSQVFSDGTTFTVYSQPQNAYVSIPASPTLDATLARAQAAEVVELPGVDLLYRDSYGGLMEDTIAGESVGLSIVDGVPTHHLAFRGRDVDWQIWIEDGPRPLPRKYVITSKNVEGAPDYEIVLSQWNLDPRLGDDFFRFQPPTDARPLAPR